MCYSRDNKIEWLFSPRGLAQSQQTRTHANALTQNNSPKESLPQHHVQNFWILFSGYYVFALVKFKKHHTLTLSLTFFLSFFLLLALWCHWTVLLYHILVWFTHRAQKQKTSHSNNKTLRVKNWFQTQRLFSQKGRCFACKDLWYYTGRGRRDLFSENSKTQGGPSVIIYATIWQKVKVTILVFTIAPGGKESEAMFGTTGRTGFLLLFPLWRGRKKQQHCE